MPFIQVGHLYEFCVDQYIVLDGDNDFLNDSIVIPVGVPCMCYDISFSFDTQSLVAHFISPKGFFHSHHYWAEDRLIPFGE